MLTREQLATLIGTSTAHIKHLIDALAVVGLVRTFELDVPLADVLKSCSRVQRPIVVVELTQAGRRDVAARLLLPTTAADRHHRLLGWPRPCAAVAAACPHNWDQCRHGLVCVVREARAPERWSRRLRGTGGVPRHARMDAFDPMVTAATAVTTHVSASSSSMTGGPNVRRTTPPSWRPTTGTVTPARARKTMTAFPPCWLSRPLKQQKHGLPMRPTWRSGNACQRRFQCCSRRRGVSPTTRTAFSVRSGAQLDAMLGRMRQRELTGCPACLAHLTSPPISHVDVYGAAVVVANTTGPPSAGWAFEGAGVTTRCCE